MILTICPNPSMDCTIELDSLNVGMLNRIQNKTITYSGKAQNVAVAVARLSGKVFSTGFMFEDEGKMFERVLDREGISHKFVWNKGSVRVNYKIIDNKSMLTEINDKGALVEREKQLELIELVKNLSKEVDIAVMSGSLPKGVDSSFYKEVLSVIPSNVKKIVDTEKQNLDYALETGVYMVKPNLRELEGYVNKSLKTKKEVINASYKLLDKGAKLVLVSLGADGAILTNGTKSYYSKSANVAVNSKVGAGDSMVAAFAVKTLEEVGLEELLKCSVSAGTAAVTTRGTNLFTKDKYEEIYQQITVEEIK
ncbi:MAG: 1-phosphofructokinase family hexose kinase [Clostridiales bacterium]|nr:1-phosphofructokinase family hexose kinase [Clostridiales bacterium]